MISPLADRRADLGLTQDQLGEAIGVGAMTISRWERGASLPRRRYWPKLSELTGLKIVEIIGADE